MFNKHKKKAEEKTPLTPEEKKVAWKGGTYNKVLHAIDPKAKGSVVIIKSDLFKNTKPDEVSTTVTDENTKINRPETSRKKMRETYYETQRIKNKTS